MGRHAQPDDANDGWIWTGQSWRYAPLAAEAAYASTPVAPFQRQPAISWPAPRPAIAVTPSGGSGGLPPYVGFGSVSPADPDPWRKLRVWWGERTDGDRRVIVGAAVLAAIVTIIGVTAGSSSSSSSSASSSSATWYSDLGPTDLTSEYTTYYEGQSFNMPKPTASQIAAFDADVGASDPGLGMATCSDLRYGTETFPGAQSWFTNTMNQSDTRARQFIRASLLDLCPA
jgi:hypothetical protein